MKQLVGLLAAGLLLVSCQQDKPKGNLHLTGNVEGLSKGVLYIKRVADTSLVAVDTIKIDGNSHFESWLNIQSPEVYYLFLDRGTTQSIDDRLPFFAEAGTMDINTTLEHFFADAKITGSKNQKLLDDYNKVSARFAAQKLDYTEAALRKQHANAKANVDSLVAMQNNVLKRKYLYAVNFALNNRDHEVAPFIALSEINDVNLKYLDTICKSMSPKVAQSYYGKKLIAYYNERKKAGL